MRIKNLNAYRLFVRTHGLAGRSDAATRAAVIRAIGKARFAQMFCK